jgi:hypothetical protein
VTLKKAVPLNKRALPLMFRPDVFLGQMDF